jgi:alanyl-tRNA synthetase
MSLQDTSAASLREKFLSFFQKKGHERVPSSSLVPENDVSVLFTTAGMQQFKRFYLFPDEASSSRATTCQKCVRTGDIEEVGDQTHLTFFEMLGNFSFGYQEKEGSYFKKEAIEWAWEFLTRELEIEKSRISATYFAGDQGIPEDSESRDLLKEITALEDSKILGTGFSETFWSLGSEGSPGGPTVEFYIDGIEVWNLVFNQYVMQNGKYELSRLKGVDTGMGFERLVAMMQRTGDVYQTDLFAPIIKKIEELSTLEYGDKSDSDYINEDQQCWVDVRKDFRVIADHIRSACFMVNDGIEPSNKGQGYILRRLIRRAIVRARSLKIEENFSNKVAEKVFEVFSDYEFIQEKIQSELEKEESKFRKTLGNGLKEFEKLSEKINGKVLFDLYQTYGFPLELSVEVAKSRGIEISENEIQEYLKMLSSHQELSRTASAGMFKGGLEDSDEQTIRLHTAAHLLLAALRQLLGPQVNQKGSNITKERLRFDFNHPEKLTDEQIKKIEDIVNEKIKENLIVTKEEMSVEEAKNSGASGVFDDRYGDRVKVYTVGPEDVYFSREICGGPHVGATGELGHFKIIKEESSSAGTRRIKAILE